MTMQHPRDTDLPAPFIRAFRPVIANQKEKGLRRYLFDDYGLEFYRRLVTADKVTPGAIWSVARVPGNNTLRLMAGHGLESVGFVITEVPCGQKARTIWELPRRLTYRQRVHQHAVKSIIDELLRAPIAVPQELLELLHARMEVFP